jgi:hypothetical protein
VVLADERTGWPLHFDTDTLATVSDILPAVADRFCHRQFFHRNNAFFVTLRPCRNTLSPGRDVVLAQRAGNSRLVLWPRNHPR